MECQFWRSSGPRSLPGSGATSVATTAPDICKAQGSASTRQKRITSAPIFSAWASFLFSNVNSCFDGPFLVSTLGSPKTPRRGCPFGTVAQVLGPTLIGESSGFRACEPKAATGDLPTWLGCFPFPTIKKITPKGKLSSKPLLSAP